MTRYVEVALEMLTLRRKAGQYLTFYLVKIVDVALKRYQLHTGLGHIYMSQT